MKLCVVSVFQLLPTGRGAAVVSVTDETSEIDL